MPYEFGPEDWDSDIRRALYFHEPVQRQALESLDKLMARLKSEEGYIKWLRRELDTCRDKLPE